MKAVFDGRTAVVTLAQAPYWCAGGVIVSNRTVPEVLDSSLAVAYKIVRSYIHPRNKEHAGGEEWPLRRHEGWQADV